MRLLAHLDDVGMSLGSVEAWQALSRSGIVRSASTMVPCPFYPMARDHWQDNPGQDMGVHITLTSEWSTYRWRPLTGRHGGLVDDEGYFHKRPDAVLSTADPVAVADEMEAQISQVFSDGLQPTHLDAHMGTALLDPFIWSLFDLGKKYDLPVLACRRLETLLKAVRIEGLDKGFFNEVLAEATTLGWPIFDNFMIGFCGEGSSMETHLDSLIAESDGALVYYGLHADTAVGMDGFAPHHTHARRAEYEFFSDVSNARFFEDRQINLCTWKDLKK